MPDSHDQPPFSSVVKSVVASQAASLYERAAIVAESSSPPPDGEALARGAAILKFWNQVFAPGDEEALLRRLSWDGLDRQRALAAAASDRLLSPAALPAWTQWLDRFAASAGGVLKDLLSGTLEEANPHRWANEPPFLELWIAPLRAARQELVARVPAAARAGVRESAMWALEQQLVRELSIWAERATFEAFQSATPGSSDRYRTFVDGLLEAAFVPLWTKWPLIARHMAIVTGSWVESTAELLERLALDRPAIAAVFAGRGNPGELVGIDPALSDPHHGRRRVSVLRFESGLRVVYKPRDLGLDRAFGDLLRWLASRGLDPAPRALAVLERGGYGWVEFASHDPVPSSDRVETAFRQSGSLLCLAHVLRGRDLHAENVVATAGGPVLIDVEPLLQPIRRSHQVTLDADGNADETSGEDESCLATGLLHLYELGPDGEVFDAGGLCGDGTGTLTLPKRVWKNLRSSSLACEPETTFATAGRNRVMFGGKPQPVEDHVRQVLEGFAATYRLLMAERDRLVAADGPLAAFAGCRTRVIPRPTNQYAMLSAVLAGPRYQDNGARRSAALDILLRPYNRHESRPAIWPALLEERRALEALDIPYFWVAADDVVVHAGDGDVEDYFVRSGLAACRDRLNQLSEADLEAERRAVARALSESPRSRFATPFAASAAGRSNDDRTRQILVDHAVWIGDELRRLSRSGPDGLTWWNVQAANQAVLCPHALYHGAVGVALFIAALHVVTREPRWADMAREALAPVFRSLERGEFESWEGDSIGAGDGLGSVVFGLTCAGSLLDDRRCLDAALEIAGGMAPRIAGDEHDDVLSGAAGALLALLALHHARPDGRLLEWAAACGARLIDRRVEAGEGVAWPVDGALLVGFAHGAAGIAYALERLHRETDLGDVGRTAERGRRFVRGQFLPGEGNWPAAGGAEASGSLVMTAWCHGAPGVVLANALAFDRDDPEARLEMDAALSTTARWRPGRADHLCCGTLGRAEALLTVGRHLGRPDAAAAAQALAGRVIERARRAEHFRLSAPGQDYRVFDPGFFRGLSGIGYALLRLAEPAALPAVLWFAVRD